MKTISYYISMVVILAATIFTGCTDDDEKSLSPRAGELSIYVFITIEQPKLIRNIRV